jgi:formylglycine-generating enzyme required for sulfatase activity
MSHIFISYSTKNADYAYRLADKLRDEGFDVWIDNDELRASDNWWESIVRALRAASAFVVIMTPASRDSRWVQREVTLADNWGKPAFPLLLEGENFEIYVLTQFHNVKDATLPRAKYYDDLARYAKRENRKGQVVTEETSAQALNDAAVKAALRNAPLPEITINHIEMQTLVSVVPALPMPRKPSIQEYFPQPFDWCEIPAGQVTLEEGGYVPEGGQTFDVSAFLMAKYPITNAQYKLFVDAGGYKNKAWWTDVGWQEREKGKWREPRYWKDVNYRGYDKPIVGVSWYESIAFCFWLSETTGEKIMLPTEQQWQRAAQGDDGRTYPWGKKFDKTKANTEESGIGKTTPVKAFPNGASPYGVFDMAGNVWEWCLTHWETGSNDVNGKDIRPLRGGAFYSPSYLVRSMSRFNLNPHYGDGSWSFRLCADARVVS